MPDKWDRFAGPSGEQCRRCYYFKTDGDGDGHGFCHRYPPKFHNTVIYIDDPGGRDGFPEPVSDITWCGEFRLHPGAEAGANTKFETTSSEKNPDE